MIAVALSVLALNLGPDAATAFVFPTGPRTYALVDPGSAEGALQALAAKGIPAQQVRWILLTHAHVDHSAGAADLQRRLGARIVATARTAQILARGRDDRCLYAGNGAPLTPTRVDVVFNGPTRLQLDAVRLLALPAPGHTRDSSVYWVDGALFLGDLPYTSWDGNTHEALGLLPQTIASLRTLRVQRVYAAHGGDYGIADFNALPYQAFLDLIAQKGQEKEALFACVRYERPELYPLYDHVACRPTSYCAVMGPLSRCCR